MKSIPQQLVPETFGSYGYYQANIADPLNTGENLVTLAGHCSGNRADIG